MVGYFSIRLKHETKLLRSLAPLPDLQGNASMTVHMYAGTAGHSAWFSDDLGLTWVHPNSHSGMYLEARVWSITSHPATPGHLFAGTDCGIFRWDEASARWISLPSPAPDIWAIAQDPADPQHLLAGGRPAALFESHDAGQHWRQLDLTMDAFSPINNGPTRVTQILFDPVDPDTVWATVEIGSVYRSRDRGRRWQRLSEGLVSADLHGIAVVPSADGRGKHVYVTTNQGLHRSDDDGEHWQLQPLDNPWQYTRGIVPRADDPSIIFLGSGNGPPGNDGRLLRSRDHGLHWSPVRLPGDLNSTVWCIATDVSDPMLIMVATNLGQLFRSRDGGESWERMPHEFGEIRALHWRGVPDGTRQAEHSITRPMVKAPW